MVILFITAHVVMTHTPFGRYVYAVGGNVSAARLSGVPVMAVLITVYIVCGLCAGVAGVLDASHFLTGRPKAGEFYELQVIAAVVVGGTSLMGGEGKILEPNLGVSGLPRPRVFLVLGCAPELDSGTEMFYDDRVTLQPRLPRRKASAAAPGSARTRRMPLQIEEDQELNMIMTYNQ